MFSKIPVVWRYARTHGWRRAVQRIGAESRRVALIPGPMLSDRVVRHDGGARRAGSHVRILLCAHVASKEIFGGERSFFDIVDGLNAIGAEVFAAIPRGAAPSYIAALRPRVAAVLTLPYGWWQAGTPEDERTIADFAGIIAGEGITAVHANTIMLREPLTAARRMGIPGIIHVREHVAGDRVLCQRIGLPPERILAEVVARADLLVTNSRFTAAAFEGQTQVPVALVYNKADFASLSQVAPRGEGVLRVGLISSNLPKKGLEAVAHLARKMRGNPGVEFCLIGPRNGHTDAVADAVRVLGYRETPAEAVAELDVVLSLSDFAESFGRTVLEAQAAGRPVIVWDRGAPPEIVRDGETGFIVPPGDLDAVAQAIETLARDPARYAEMSRQARSHARDRFGDEAYNEQLKAAYARCAEGFSVRPLTLAAREDVGRYNQSDLRIAYFVWHFPVRSETFVLNELRMLREQGYDVLVFCKGSPQPDFTPDFEITWEIVIDADHLAHRLIKTGRTICHSHFVYPTVTEMLYPACEKARIPFTFIPHAQDIFRYKNDQKNRIGEIARSDLCRTVFVPSNFHRKYLAERGVPLSKMVLNPNGCEVRRYAKGRIDGRESRPFRRISSIHRFTEKKGLVRLIRAAKHLEGDGITIAIHGYGELEAEYRKIIREEKIRGVEILGPVVGIEGMLEVFRTSDLFACPSVRAADGDMDGIPTVLMEAMAAGVPVLTTALSGIPDLVIDGQTGIVCEVEPEAIAARIRDFYGLSDVNVRGISEAALEHVVQNFNTDSLVDILLRVWRNDRVDLMIVSWNSPDELREVIARLRKNTSLPYHLTVCDNGSDPETLTLLLSIYAEDDAMTLVLNRENIFVGPGTNICLNQGSGEIAIYICGKEGMTTAWGWERSFIETFRRNPEVGLAGTLGYSPTYLDGAAIEKNLAPFLQFRNRDFAQRNRSRVFQHVQGGFFGIRREMFKAIGGFSEQIPHNHTDVEYSYFVESMGWALGTVPSVMSLYNKTRPSLAQRVDEHHGALHPPALQDLAGLDRIARGEVNHCNLCGESCQSFLIDGDETLCPHCRSDRLSRTIFRALAELTLLYRRLPAVGIGVPAGLQPFWSEQFQGKILSLEQFARSSSGYRDRRLALVGLFGDDIEPRIVVEAVRVLADHGTLLAVTGAPVGALDQGLREGGLVQIAEKRFRSRVLDFLPVPVLIYERPRELGEGFAR